MNARFKSLFAACGLLTLSWLAAPALSATGQLASDAQTSALEELDEVILHGKRLEQRLRESEARFYQRYNVLNNRQDLDVTCEYFYFDRDSVGMRAMSRQQGCVPIFFADAARVPVGNGSMSGPGRCITRFASPAGMFRYAAGSTGYLGEYPQAANLPDLPDCSGMISDAPLRATSNAVLLWTNRQSEFKANMARVLASDAQLQALADQLDGLAAEGRESRRMLMEYRKLRMIERRCVPGSPRSADARCRL